MNDEERLLLEALEAAPAAGGTAIHETSPYQSEQESMYSNDSCTVNDDPMEAIEYDSWDDDPYYDMSGVQDEIDGDNSSYYETLPPDLLDTTEELSTIDDRVILPEISEMVDETLEENNNDPNNNMDSIETVVAAVGPSTVDQMEESSEIIERQQSPRPGCSKDSLPVPKTEKYQNYDECKITKILHYISKINRDSILCGIEKNPNLAIGDIKILDLLPENERVEYQRDIGCSIETRMKSSSVGMENWMKKIELVNNVGTGTSGENCSIMASTTSKIKRGPTEDICNVEWKKSSSKPDTSFSLLKISSPILVIPKAASTSQIDQIAQPRRPQSTKISINQQATAITKSIRNDEMNERKTALIVVTAPVTATAAGATVTATAASATVTATAASATATATTSSYRPKVQFPPVDPAIQAQPKRVTKSQITHKTVPPLRITFHPGSIPKIIKVKEPLKANQQPAVTANVVTALVTTTAAGATVTATTSSYRPNVQFPTVDPAIQPQPKLVAKSQIAHQTVPSSRTSFHPGSIPKVRNVKEPLKVKQQPAATANIAQISHPTEAKIQSQPEILILEEKKLKSEQQKNQQPQQVRNKYPPSQKILYGQQQRKHNNDPPALEERKNLPMQEGQQQQQQEPQNTKRVVCMDMYCKLRSIFPNVDRKYIEKLCPPEWGPGDRDAQLAPLIEHLLAGGDNIPMTPIVVGEDNARRANESNEISGNVDDVYETLIAIFPDADPHYLREFAEKNVTKPNAVKEFVESRLENHDYPTREQYMARLKITEQQRQYTSGFDIKHYLTIIPDPVKHFMDPNRKNIYNTVAFEFLKTYFNKVRVTTISREYCAARYNLSLTTARLALIGSDMKAKRSSLEMPTEDILLLQEIAFIKHKEEINDYMENARRQEEAEFNMLKEKNLLIECQCCYDDECVPSKCSTCENGHSFCNSCVINGTSSKMGEGETRISCFVNCGSEFSLSTLQRVLAPTTFSILLKKRQAAEVIEAGLEGLVSCPFCHFASIPPEEDKVFKCLNPECTKESCRLCKELSHVPLKCNEVMQADKARRYIEEKMTEALARKCYKCQRAFFKEEGCNKITCPCGAIMCYLCDQPIESYSHFRGQGSNAKNLCPLYSDTIRLDAVAVHKVAEQAQKEVMKLHPNVKIDTAKLLPTIPRPTQGPHTAVLNADELPRRAQRVLDLHPQPL